MSRIVVMEKPKIAEILGVEVDEVFEITWMRLADIELHIDKDGVLRHTDGSIPEGHMVCYVLNNSEYIRRVVKPRFSERELGALRLLYDAGMLYMVRDSGALKVANAVPSWASEVLGWSVPGIVFRFPRKLFPQVKDTDTEPLDIKAVLREAGMLEGTK
jgi:hypothetical protein